MEEDIAQRITGGERASMTIIIFFTEFLEGILKVGQLSRVLPSLLAVLPGGKI